VPGTSDDEARPAPQGEPAAPEIIDGIQSLHDRIDELHHLVAQRLAVDGVQAGEWLHEHAGVVYRRPALPAWRRVTQGELRWPVTVTLFAVAALQVLVPGKLVPVEPTWVLPAAEGLLMFVLIMANPHRIDRQSRFMRTLSLSLGALLTLANGWSLARLTVAVTKGHLGQDAAQLLITGAIIWLTNVTVFALWYWEFDRGGPVARALNVGNRLPDFQFPQMVSPPEMVSPDWEPIFFDYLYLAFTNATAFSPTDVMPMSRWAKAAMTLQSVISIITLALVISRAVNIFPTG
jgi:hypothetical protein